MLSRVCIALKSVGVLNEGRPGPSAVQVDHSTSPLRSTSQHHYVSSSVQYSLHLRPRFLYSSALILGTGGGRAMLTDLR